MALKLPKLLLSLKNEKSKKHIYLEFIKICIFRLSKVESCLKINFIQICDFNCFMQKEFPFCFCAFFLSSFFLVSVAFFLLTIAMSKEVQIYRFKLSAKVFNELAKRDKLPLSQKGDGSFVSISQL